MGSSVSGGARSPSRKELSDFLGRGRLRGAQAMRRHQDVSLKLWRLWLGHAEPPGELAGNSLAGGKDLFGAEDERMFCHFAQALNSKAIGAAVQVSGDDCWYN